MAFRYFNVVDLQSRQYPFEIQNGITIKTATEEFTISPEHFNEQKMFDLVNTKINFLVIGKTATFAVNASNIVGVMYTEN